MKLASQNLDEQRTVDIYIVLYIYICVRVHACACIHVRAYIHVQRNMCECMHENIDQFYRVTYNHYVHRVVHKLHYYNSV